MINGIHHVAMVTPDLERIVAFYRDVLGFKEISRSSWPKGTAVIDRIVGLKDSAADTVMLSAGNAVIEFFHYRSPAPAGEQRPRNANDRGYTHFAIDVTDIDAEYQRLKAAGATFDSPPCDFGTIKATYGRDPDGNLFEIQELIGAGNPLRVVG